MLTLSGGARTTAGCEAGAEYLGAAENLEDAAECRKAAAGGAATFSSRQLAGRGCQAASNKS